MYQAYISLTMLSVLKHSLEKKNVSNILLIVSKEKKRFYHRKLFVISKNSFLSHLSQTTPFFSSLFFFFYNWILIMKTDVHFSLLKYQKNLHRMVVQLISKKEIFLSDREFFQNYSKLDLSTFVVSFPTLSAESIMNVSDTGADLISGFELPPASPPGTICSYISLVRTIRKSISLYRIDVLVTTHFLIGRPDDVVSFFYDVWSFLI